MSGDSVLSVVITGDNLLAEIFSKCGAIRGAIDLVPAMAQAR